MMQKKDTWLASRALLVALATTPLAAPMLVSESLLAQTPTPTPSFALPQNFPSGTTVQIDGSTSMAAINESLKQRFEKQFSGTKVELTTNGSDAALQSLLDGKIDLAAIGRPLTEAEKAQGLTPVPVRREKIAIVVGEENPLQGSLSSEQFAKIFRGEIKDWSEVGGPRGKIRVIDRISSSDTRQAFRNYPVFKKAPFQAGGTASEIGSDNTADMIKQLGKDGIGYAIANQVTNVPGVRILQMHKTLPDDPRYPFSQPLVYVYKKTPSTPAAGFLGFVGAPEAQQAIDQAREAEAAKVVSAVGNTSAAPNTTATPTTDSTTASATPESTATPTTDSTTASATPESTATPTTDSTTANATPTTDRTTASATPAATPGVVTTGADAVTASGSATPDTATTGATSSPDVAVVPPAVGNAANAVSAAGDGGLSPWWFLLLLPLLGLLGWWWSNRRRADSEYTENLPPPVPGGSFSTATDREPPTPTPSTPAAINSLDNTSASVTDNVMNTGDAALAGGAALAAGAGAAAMGAFSGNRDRETPESPAIADPWEASSGYNSTNGTSEASVNQVEDATVSPSNLVVDATDSSPNLLERITDTAANVTDKVTDAGNAALAGGAALAAGAGAAAMGAFDHLRPDDTPEQPAEETPPLPVVEVTPPIEVSDNSPNLVEGIAGATGNLFDKVTDAGNAALAGGAALAAGAGAAGMGAFDHLRSDETPEQPAEETPQLPVVEITPQPESSNGSSNWWENVTDAGNAALAGGAALAAGAGAAAMGAFDRLRPDDTPEQPSGETPGMPVVKITPQVSTEATESNNSTPNVVEGIAGVAGNLFDKVTDAGNAAIAGGAALAAGVGAAAIGAANSMATQPDATPEAPVADTPAVPIHVYHDYDSRIKLIPCEPQGAYTHWQISDAHKQALRNEGGTQLALRLMDVTDIDPSYQSPRNIQEFDLEETASDRFVSIPAKHRNYIVEIGYVTNDGNWMPLARSATTRIPSYTPRNLPLDVNAELILHGSTEPGATLTIGGRIVKLSEDGSFRVRIPFPNGSLEYPIMTVSTDGEQASILHMHFTRETGEEAS